MRNYHELNKEKESQQHKEWYAANKEEVNRKHKLYYEQNKQRIKEQRLTNRINANNRIKERKKTEPLFKLKTNIRSLVRETIKFRGYRKKTKSEEILGCSFDTFKAHIESQFEPWMNWDNYGNPKDGIFESNKTWDIDHIVPMATAITEDDVTRLNHYTNLQPLCSYENRWVKSNKQR